MRVNANRRYETAMVRITKEYCRALNSMAKITFLFKLSDLLAELHEHTCPEMPQHRCCFKTIQDD
jgi:hypothetical protein